VGVVLILTRFMDSYPGSLDLKVVNVHHACEQDSELRARHSVVSTCPNSPRYTAVHVVKY
jgi:hypothetical protein